MDVTDPETGDAHPELHRAAWQDSQILFDQMLQYITTLQRHRDHLINTLHHRDQEIQDLCYTLHKAECRLIDQQVNTHIYKDLMDTMILRLQTKLQRVKDLHSIRVNSLEEELSRMSRLLEEERKKNNAEDIQGEIRPLKMQLILSDEAISKFEEANDFKPETLDLDIKEVSDDTCPSRNPNVGTEREADLESDEPWRDKVRALEEKMEQKLTEEWKLLEENKALQEDKLLWDAWEYGGLMEDISDSDLEENVRAEDGEMEMEGREADQGELESRAGFVSRLAGFLWRRKK